LFSSLAQEKSENSERFWLDLPIFNGFLANMKKAKEEEKKAGIKENSPLLNNYSA
jgi:hypothetical protein